MNITNFHPGLAVGIMAIIATMGISVAAVMTTTKTITTTGDVEAIGVGVYSNSACTTVLNSISWGAVEPGTSVNSTMYIKNNGNVPVILSMTTTNWNSSIRSYFTVVWNRETYVLNPGAVVQANLMLTISSSITGVSNFSFDIVITGTEQ